MITGETTFGAGTPAPLIGGSPVQEYNNGTDHIALYKKEPGYSAWDW